MPYNLLLLPLIGGFLFIHIAHYFRFAAQRADGYRLLFQAAIAGVALSILGRFVVIVLDLTSLAPPVRQAWHVFSPFPYSGTSAISLLLGPFFGCLLNLCINKDKAKKVEIEARGNFLLRLLDEAATQSRLISVTLDSRKWYVGWVAETPNLNPHEQFFRLLPFISGYRDKDGLEPRRTVYYDAVLRDVTLDRTEFVITLPLKDVKIAGFFNDEIYDEYFAEEPAPEEPVPPVLLN
jgi:hypothetical protein